MKTCNTCELEKPLDAFTKTGGNGPRKDKPRGQCRLCRSKVILEWKLNNKYRYNLSGEEYRALLEKQDNCCAICKRPFVTNPSIDHDHACCPGRESCGKCVRGLLCAGCNHLLGNAQDNLDILEAAKQYLIERKL